jgi:predicted acyl esterase
MRILKDQRITTSDGITIGADVYLPDGDEPVPALYAVSPYQKATAYLPPSSAFRFRETGPIEWWVEECGYAYVLADMRGTGTSEGDFELFSARDQQDYHESIEWIAEQPWSTGKVGMIGESGYSVNTWLAAATRPPHLACALIYNAFTDLYRDAVYHGGIYSMGFMNFWTVDNIRASATIGGGAGATRPGGVGTDIIGMALDHPLDGPFWRERSPDVEAIECPTMVIGWWYNIGLHLRGTLQGFERLQCEKKLAVLEGTDSDSRNFDTDFLDQQLRPWYDHWLKGDDNGVMDTPPVQLDVQHGESLRAEQEWPLARAVPTPWYLDPAPARAVHSLNDGSLRTTPPTTDPGPTEYAYPNPEWTVGTTIIRNGIPQPALGELTFTSEPLEDDLEVTGPIKAVLYVESDQTDTEFFVKVSEQAHVPKLKEVVMGHVAGDVPPPSVMVTRGWLKASHRAVDPERSTDLVPFHPHTDPQPIVPGDVVRYDIEVWPTSYRFSKGSRICIEIANGDSMVADGLFHHYYGHKAGTDRIHHSAQHPSHVLLPLVPS